MVTLVVGRISAKSPSTKLHFQSKADTEQSDCIRSTAGPSRNRATNVLQTLLQTTAGWYNSKQTLNAKRSDCKAWLSEENLHQTGCFQVCHVHIGSFQLQVKFAGAACSGSLDTAWLWPLLRLAHACSSCQFIIPAAGWTLLPVPLLVGTSCRKPLLLRHRCCRSGSSCESISEMTTLGVLKNLQHCKLTRRSGVRDATDSMFSKRQCPKHVLQGAYRDIPMAGFHKHHRSQCRCPLLRSSTLLHILSLSPSRSVVGINIQASCMSARHLS